MVQYSPRLISQGKKRLKSLRVKAKDEAKKDLLSTKSALYPNTALGQSALENIKEKHIVALVIYQTEPDQWYADVLLENTPFGVPNVLGTAVAHPEKSEEDALKAGYLILVTIYKSILERKIANTDFKAKKKRVFSLYDCEVEIDATMMDEVGNRLLGVPREFRRSAEDVGKSLDLCIQKIMGGTCFDPEKWKNSKEEDKFLVIMHIIELATHGMFRHPPRDYDEQKVG